MPISHILLAILVAVVWGFNFIAVKFALVEVSPLFLCALRFFLASVPAIFFIKRPEAPFKLVLLYGFVVFGLQFSLVFMGMNNGMSPGLASILMQTQVFFSMFFAMLALAEIPRLWQLIGAVISFSGIGVVAMHLDKTSSLVGFILILSAAASWGVGNLITKKIGKVNMMSLVVWGSFAAFLPLLFLSMMVEGTHNIVYSMQHLSLKCIFAILFIVYMSTWVGYGTWNWLICRHPVASIVPFSLLVPVFGMLSSVIILDEPFYLWKLIAGLLVISGLGINLLAPKLFERRLASEM